MPKYLFVSSYTLDGIKGLRAEGGSARKKESEDALESVGGSLESFYFAFGDSDVYIIADLPDNTAAAATAVAVAAGGGLHTKTVVLLTPEEMDAACKREVDHRPPGH
jgi:uncharacterized protein with GYD domain